MLCALGTADAAHLPLARRGGVRAHARIAPRCDSRPRPGGSAGAKRDLLVGVRLQRGVTACLHCPTRASWLDWWADRFPSTNAPLSI